jgi:8-oxo-dGTP pyrophosphatase MutT (NUDIX family)
MVRRSRDAAFMGGAHVFPGGAIDDVDRSDAATRVIQWDGDPDELPWRSAAVRELAEEAGVLLCDDPPDLTGLEGAEMYRALAASGVRLDAGRLEWVSNWVTPQGPPRRFDTRFFITIVAAGTAASSDRREVFDAEWVDPAGAIAAADAGAWQIEFPTRVHLEMLASFGSADEVLQHARDAKPHRIEPRLMPGPDGVWTLVLPGDPGFEGAG